LRDYKKGARKNPMMMPMAQSLSKQDIKDLAANYSSLKGDQRVKY
jgi:cytochrome c553